MYTHKHLKNMYCESVMSIQHVRTVREFCDERTKIFDEERGKV